MVGSAHPGFQGSSDDFVEGRIRTCRIGEETLVATRLGGRVCAVAGTCPHRGAPLAEGVLDGRRLICPWHHATFDITSGELLDAPALDPLRRYAVEESGGTVSIAEAPEPPASPRGRGRVAARARLRRACHTSQRR
jgi:nitrite reductase/ring-hydroxylating ferredoxin subunit